VPTTRLRANAAVHARTLGASQRLQTSASGPDRGPVHPTRRGHFSRILIMLPTPVCARGTGSALVTTALGPHDSRQLPSGGHSVVPAMQAARSPYATRTTATRARDPSLCAVLEPWLPAVAGAHNAGPAGVVRTLVRDSLGQ
jgi:hypothetical protein